MLLTTTANVLETIGPEWLTALAAIATAGFTVTLWWSTPVRLQHQIMPGSRRLGAHEPLSNEVFERRSGQCSRPVSDHCHRLALLSRPL